MSQKFTLIQQNDTHAQMELHWEAFWRNGQLEYRRTGGYARAATIIRQIREETGGACLLVDCGDAIHGTGPAQWTHGAAIVPVLNHMGVQVMTPGNWEFGFGPQVLRQRVATMEFPVIACNIQNGATGELEFPASHVCEVGGVRVGLIGITSPIVTETMPSPFGLGLRFVHPLDALPNQISRLRSRDEVDLIVVISHYGFPQDVQLARNINGIDIILSSHTHNRLARPVQVGKTTLIQSGFGGSFLGRLDIEAEKDRPCQVMHQLIVVAESIQPDHETEKVINAELDPFREKLDEIIGQTSTPLNRMTVLEATMDNLITDAYLDISGADVAFSHGWRYGSPIPPGNVTLGDIWQIIPTNPEIFTVQVKGSEILNKLEESLESVFTGNAFQQKGGYVIRTSGLNAVVRINNPRGTRIEQLDIAGSHCDPNRIYRVAAAGGQDVQDWQNKENTGVRAIDALRQYFREHSPINSDLTHTKFVAI